MLIGEWTRPQAPLPGELLTSCLARNAFAHFTTPYRFLALFRGGDPVWDRDFDRDPGKLSRCRRPRAPDWLDDLAALMHVDRALLEDATLAAWRHSLAGPRRLGGDTPLVLSVGVHHRTRTRHALQFCPDCLAEGTPHFRKEWRLGFVVACPRHGRALQDACGHCGAPVVPHRSFTGEPIGCHACGRPITGGRSARAVIVVPQQASAMQEGLLSTLLDEDGRVPGPWVDREVFDVVRCLIAASAPGSVHAGLRTALALDDTREPAEGRMRFEQCRLAVRLPWLEMVAAWMADWPIRFRIGADAAGLTRRTFARLHVPPSLAKEVARLPAGMRRDRGWEPVLEEPVLRRLRRVDPALYRSVRAERILGHCCHRRRAPGRGRTPGVAIAKGGKSMERAGTGNDGPGGSRSSGKDGRIGRVLDLAIGHVNASTPQPITKSQMIDAIRTGTPPAGFEHHVRAFLDETDLGLLSDLVVAGGATYAELARLADTTLSAGHETREWLDGRRDI